MVVMETTWDDVGLMRRGRLVPGGKSHFQSTAVERWKHVNTQDSGAPRAFCSCLYLSGNYGEKILIKNLFSC